MTENVKAQRVRIIREIEAAATHDSSGKLPWRNSWAAYFGDRAGLLDALATRRQCLAIIDVGALHEQVPDEVSRAALTRQLRRTDAGLNRILVRYGGVCTTAPAEPA